MQNFLCLVLCFFALASGAFADSAITDEETSTAPALQTISEPQEKAEQALVKCRTTGGTCKKEQANLARTLWQSAWSLYQTGGKRACEDALPRVQQAFEVYPALGEWWPVQVATECSMRLGYNALVDGNLAAARGYFEAVLPWAAHHAKHKARWEKESHPRVYLDLIGRLEKLPATTPLLQHKILAVHVLKTDAIQNYPGKGVRQCSGEVSAEVVENIKRQQKVIALYYRAISHGKLELSFENRISNGTARELSPTTILSDAIEPPIGELLKGTAPVTDTYVIYSHCPKPCTAVATGGLATRPLIPYQLNTPIRGHINVHLSYSQGYYISVFLHEFFHIVGALIGVDGHGYQQAKRGKYPGWKDPKNDEHSFRVWHFEQLLSELDANPAAARFLKLKIRDVYPAGIDHYAEHLAVTKEVPPERRREANKIAIPLNDLHFKKKDYRAVIRVADEALALNPWQPRALIYKGKAHGIVKEYPEAIDAFNRYLTLNRGSDLEVQLYRCDYLGKTGQNDDRRQCLQELLRDFPNGPLGAGAFEASLYERARRESRNGLCER